MSRTNDMSATQLYSFYRNFGQEKQRTAYKKSTAETNGAKVHHKISSIMLDRALQRELDNDDIASFDPFA